MEQDDDDDDDIEITRLSLLEIKLRKKLKILNQIDGRSDYIK